MGLLSNLTNVATGGIAGLASSALGMAEGANQRKASQRAYRHRYQWQMSDMKKAGLNPILAGSLGAGNAASMAAGSTSSDLTKGIQTAIQQDQATADINLKTANQALTESKTVLSDNLIPGTEAIATVTQQVANLAKAAENLMGKDAQGYQDILLELKSAALESMEKLSQVGGQAEKAINEIQSEIKNFNLKNWIFGQDEPEPTSAKHPKEGFGGYRESPKLNLDGLKQFLNKN